MDRRQSVGAPEHPARPPMWMPFNVVQARSARMGLSLWRCEVLLPLWKDAGALMEPDEIANGVVFRGLVWSAEIMNRVDELLLEDA